jgi:uncharacterized membrane protein
MFNTAHLHPMLVHFPIAIILVGFLADVAFLFFKNEKCLSKTGFYLMIAGTLAAAVAYTSGQLFANEPTQGDIVNVFERHELFALITLIIMGIGSLVRIYAIVKMIETKFMTWTIFGLYCFGALSVGITGFLGGSMVYDYMMPL